MAPLPPDRSVRDELSALLEEALRESLREATDPQLQRRVQHFRRSGVALLVLASLCILSVAMLPGAWLAIGPLWLGSASILMLFAGGWLLDKAGREEVQAYRTRVTGTLQEGLTDVPGVPDLVEIGRRRQFGVGLLVLAGFAICVVAAPLPGKQMVDVVTWAGYAVLLIVLGAWRIRKSSNEAVQAQTMLMAAERRQAAKNGPILRRTR